MTTAIGGQARLSAPSNFVDTEEHSVDISPRGELLVAQALPPKAELTRLGFTYSLAIATANAFTFVNAWPTTRAELVLYNGETGPLAKSYVIDSAWMVNITSQAAAQPYVLIGQIVPAPAAPTEDTAQLIVSRSGKTGYSGKAKKAVAQTTMTANKWELLANAAVSAMTTNLANGVFAEMYGGWILPPGAMLGLAGVAGTAAGTAIIGVTWHEVLLALG